MEYKKTLNMPKSGFPMRAGLPKREPDMLKHWVRLSPNGGSLCAAGRRGASPSSQLYGVSLR